MTGSRPTPMLGPVLPDPPAPPARLLTLLVTLGALLALPSLASASGVTPSPSALFRIGLEAGVAWLGNAPDQDLGPAALVRGRFQMSERLALSAAFLFSRQAISGSNRARVSTLVPLALEVRLDRAPVVPFLSVGWTVGNLAISPSSGQTVNGPLLGVGLEALLGGGLAFTAQASYFGLDSGSSFPFSSALTAGLEPWY